MVTTLVFNASPLICLGKADLLSLADSPEFRVLVPQAVVDEVVAGSDKDDAASSWLQTGALSAVPSTGAVDPILLAWNLGPGETAVLVEAGRQPGADSQLTGES